MQEYVLSIWNEVFIILFCRLCSACYRRFLNDRVNIFIHNKIIARLFIYQIWWVDKESDMHKRMGVWGIIGWLTLFPCSIYLWIKNGHFYFSDEGSFWYSCLCGGLLMLVAADTVVALLFGQWSKRKHARTLKNADFNTIPPELRERAEQIYRQPDKVICDDDQQEYYYICGKDLLRFYFDGTFVSLTQDADSRRVLTAMRTGRIIGPSRLTE